MSISALLSRTGKLIRVTAITFSFGYVTLNFVAEPIVCSGESMEPTIKDKNIIVIERYSSVFIKKYNRGDIVVARCPTDPHTLICKRVVAVSGDSVRQGFLSNQVIPRGHVWLIGDNPNYSTDSREFGPIPIGLILGRVVLKIWPISEFGVITEQTSSK